MIIHPITLAATESYFEDQRNVSNFLKLIDLWWEISNGKQRYNISYNFGNAAVTSDAKTSFFSKLADWFEEW